MLPTILKRMHLLYDDIYKKKCLRVYCKVQVRLSIV